jgi:hypothetical protein
MGRFDGEDGGIEVHVVLPRPLAHRGAGVGWAMPIVDVDEGRVVVGVASPTTASELRALQALLVVAYDSAFATNTETSE